MLEGTNIKVYFNNSTNASIDINDSTFTSGKIGLRTNGTPASFDNVVVHTAKCTVSFNSNGGSDVASQTVLSGNPVAEPTAPTKDQVYFGGWYTDDITFSNVYNFATPIVKNTTLYAKWNANESPNLTASNGTTDFT